MGCQSSSLSLPLTPSQPPTQSQQFTLTYRQFIINTRGQVFKFYHFSTLIHRSPGSALRKVYHRTNNIERVCKIVGVDSLKEFSCLQEIECLKGLEHPNVGRLEEYFIQKNFVYIVLEKINGFTLADGINKLKAISLANIISIMKQLFSALNMMHSQNIAHRNIHPGHIMLIPKKQEFIVKLIDFSWSCHVNAPKKKTPRPYKMGKMYTSAEANTCSLKHDIYCCGLIFLTLLGGEAELLKVRERQEEVINRIINNNNDKLAFLVPLLLSILDKNPINRPTIPQILSHSIFISNFGQENDNEPKNRIILSGLRKCNIADRLKSTLWMFATIKLYTFHNKIQLMNQFSYLDQNKDGKIQLSQLTLGLSNIFKMQPQEAQREALTILHTIDKNNNGQLDFYQFAMGAYLIGKNLSDAELRALFMEIDTNQDGVISGDELNAAVEGIEDYELLRGRGNKMDFEDFRGIMRSYIDRISEYD